MEKYDEISKIAYQLYEKSGKVGGRDMENWLEAERIVMSGQRVSDKIMMEEAGDMPKPLPEAKRTKSKRLFQPGKQI